MIYLVYLTVLTAACWIPLWPMLFPREHPRERTPQVIADIPVPTGSYNLGGLL